VIAIPSPRFPAFPVSPVSRIHPGSFLLRVAALVFLVCAPRSGAADGWTGLPDGRSHAPTDKAAPAAASPGAYRPAYGLLWLQIEPDGVAISLDGDYLDKDVWLVSLPPGDHVLRVTKPGFRPRESRFGIAAGQNVRLDVKLLPDSEG
jgi:hypothetical protein